MGKCPSLALKLGKCMWLAPELGKYPSFSLNLGKCLWLAQKNECYVPRNFCNVAGSWGHLGTVPGPCLSGTVWRSRAPATTSTLFSSLSLWYVMHFYVIHILCIHSISLSKHLLLFIADSSFEFIYIACEAKNKHVFPPPLMSVNTILHLLLHFSFKHQIVLPKHHIQMDTTTYYWPKRCRFDYIAAFLGRSITSAWKLNACIFQIRAFLRDLLSQEFGVMGSG